MSIKKLEYKDLNSVQRVIYHAPCADGFAGAYAFWKKCKRTRNNIMFIAGSHSTKKKVVREKILPWLVGQNVVLVDFTYPLDIMQELYKSCNKLLVLDHHKSAEHVFSADAELSKCSKFVMNKSGAVLAWEFCFPNKPIPMFIQCIQDRDLWKWELDETEPFTAAFYKCIPFEFQDYALYEDQEEFTKLLEEGKVLLKYDAIEIVKLAQNAVEARFLDYKVQILNSGTYVSKLGNFLAKHNECDFAMIWVYNHTNNLIKVSLRSTDEKTDVSKIAMQFGGGGHRNAAGFVYKGSDISELLQASKGILKKSFGSILKNNWKPIIGGLGVLVFGGLYGRKKKLW